MGGAESEREGERAGEKEGERDGGSNVEMETCEVGDMIERVIEGPR